MSNAWVFTLIYSLPHQSMYSGTYPSCKATPNVHVPEMWPPYKRGGLSRGGHYNVKVTLVALSSGLSSGGPFKRGDHYYHNGELKFNL